MTCSTNKFWNQTDFCRSLKVAVHIFVCEGPWQSTKHHKIPTAGPFLELPTPHTHRTATQGPAPCFTGLPEAPGKKKKNTQGRDVPCYLALGHTMEAGFSSWLFNLSANSTRRGSETKPKTQARPNALPPRKSRMRAA